MCFFYVSFLCKCSIIHLYYGNITCECLINEFLEIFNDNKVLDNICINIVEYVLIWLNF
jgi:hypothetical protein